eukprot:7275812-Karenia_brevis.AAC.1
MPAINAISELKAEAIDKYCFRLKPRFRDPHKDASRPWAWCLMFSVEAEQDIIRHWFTIARSKAAIADVAVRPARSKDGGLSKQLRDTLKGAGVAMDEESDGEAPGNKRSRGGG